MSSSSMIQAINQIFIDVLEEEHIVITPETSAADIEEWDSLNHIQMITAVEKKFKLRFKLNELLNFKNVGDLSKNIEEKVK